MKKIILIVAILAVAVVGAGFLSSAADEEARQIVVELGSSATNATEAEHDLTLEALEGGKDTFKVTADSGSYVVSLTEKQVKDLLEGTTVMAKTSGDMTVKVSLVDGEKKEKGW